MDELIKETVEHIVETSNKFEKPPIEEAYRFYSSELMKRAPEVVLHWLHLRPAPSKETLYEVAAICLLWITTLVK